MILKQICSTTAIDVAGHLTCQFKNTNSIRLSVDITLCKLIFISEILWTIALDRGSYC